MFQIEDFDGVVNLFLPSASIGTMQRGNLTLLQDPLQQLLCPATHASALRTPSQCDHCYSRIRRKQRMVPSVH